MFNRRQVMAAAAAATAFGSSRAQETAKPVTIVVAYPAGGPADMIARTVGEVLGEHLGRTVIVDNRPGAGGQIAGTVALQAPADGNTLLMGDTSTLCMNKVLYNKFSYDPLNDFQGVAVLLRMPMVLFVPKSSPFNSLAELVHASKNKPLNYASQGGGSLGHLLGDMLKSASGGQFVHVPYKGSAPAMIDLISGQVDLMFDGIGPGLPHLTAQKLKALAVAAPNRLPLLPDVPTTAEAGLRDVAMALWFGVVVRTGTPTAQVQRLNAGFDHAMKQPKVAKRFTDLGFQVQSLTPEQFSTYIKQEGNRWGAFIKARGIALD